VRKRERVREKEKYVNVVVGVEKILGAN